MIAAQHLRIGDVVARRVRRSAPIAGVTSDTPERAAPDTDSRAAERELVQRVLAGDPAAEREFYDTHVDRVYQLAYRMTHDEALTQEFTQDAFMRAFDRLGQFRGDASVATWLRRVALSVICNGLEAVRRRREKELSIDTLSAGAGGELISTLARDDSSEIGDVALHDRLMLALDALPLSQRTVVVLHDVEGFHHHEIAALLKITTTTSKVRLFRARAALRPMLTAVAAEWAW